MAEPRILLLGANGQVGYALQRSLSILADVIPVSRKECDLSQASDVRALVRTVRPISIVNAAAYTAVDRAEQDEAGATTINAELPAILSEESRALDAALIHYSTDYVYDGTKTSPYIETDSPNPASIYGRSKLQGDLAVLDTPNGVVLRTSWVYCAYGQNFLKTILRLAKERTSLRVVADQFGAPTSADLIADVTAQVLRNVLRRSSGSTVSGLFHLTASGRTSWYEYATYIVDLAHRAGLPLTLDAEGIVGIPATEYPLPAARPANSVLATEKIRAAFDVRLPAWQDGVRAAVNLIANLEGAKK
ncbi:dTDP-4-dehydrorhamnose reductase [Ralstonia mannitolilytica]|uniref:dTDP-4-dehydrorhamnose reductase n=1 Tax=Ralstonia TaxID=48736 RepID=UPI000AE91D42|nr:MULTISPECIES: dTDP-4-dehydrorhamnose reductase [Ralstonia]MBU9578543.1 dTDP-4-dehydrorhamnose reductase [Ralstonia mannitolilytica]PLT16953.1 dTDP-4-dehydrorhamnose reductase [Ralstonia mannitolilytica]